MANLFGFEQTTQLGDTVMGCPSGRFVEIKKAIGPGLDFGDNSVERYPIRAAEVTAQIRWGRSLRALLTLRLQGLKARG